MRVCFARCSVRVASCDRSNFDRGIKGARVWCRAQPTESSASVKRKPCFGGLPLRVPPLADLSGSFLCIRFLQSDDYTEEDGYSYAKPEELLQVRSTGSWLTSLCLKAPCQPLWACGHGPSVPPKALYTFLLSSCPESPSRRRLPWTRPPMIHLCSRHMHSYSPGLGWTVKSRTLARPSTNGERASYSTGLRHSRHFASSSTSITQVRPTRRVNAPHTPGI